MIRAALRHRLARWTVIVALVLGLVAVGSAWPRGAAVPSTAEAPAPPNAVGPTRPAGSSSPQVSAAPNPGPPSGTTFSIQTAVTAEDLADIEAGLGKAAWYLREHAGPDRARPITVNIVGSAIRLDDGTVDDRICCWVPIATRNGNGMIIFNVRASQWQPPRPFDIRIDHERSAAHEYTHTWMGDIGCNAASIPSWLREGIPEFVGFQAMIEFGLLAEARVDSFHATIRSAPVFLPLQDFERSLPEQAGGYTVAGLAVRRLMVTAAPPSLRRFCELVATGAAWQDAFATAFGLSVPVFYQRFEAFRKTL